VKHVGIVLHNKSFTVAELYPDDSVKCYDVALDSEQSLQAFLKRLHVDDKVAIEATGRNSYFFYELYELIKPLVEKVVIADPKEVRSIVKSRSKMDQQGVAEILARLLMGGLLQEICIPSPEIRSRRELLEYQHKQVRKKTSLKNRVHALLRRYGVSSPVSDFFGNEGKILFEEVKHMLPLYSQIELASRLREIEMYEEEIRKVDEYLTGSVLTDPFLEYLE